MATDLIMPTLPGEHEQPRIFMPQRPSHNRSQSYQIPYSTNISPLSTSTSTGSNASTPSSPKHTGRRPLYMPAVLRPNHEFEQRKLTKSATFGVDEDFSDPRRPRSGSGFANLHGLAVLGGRSRRPSKVGQELCTGWDLELFPDVTAQPTKKHWKVRKPFVLLLSRITDSSNSLIPSQLSATTLPASATSATSSAAITAVAVVTYSATGTRALSFPSTKTQTSTPGPSPPALATTASTSSRLGTAATTASPPVRHRLKWPETHRSPQSPLQRCPAPGAQRCPLLLRLPPACLGIGTGVPSEPAVTTS